MPPAKLAGRYRFVESIQAGAKTFAWLAEDEQSERRVVACAIGAARMAALSSVVGVRHPHLCTVLDVIANPDPMEIPSDRGLVKAAAVAIAEHVSGSTLHEHLKRGKLDAHAAVEMLVQVAGAVAALHEKGGAHGAISTRSIVIDSAGSKPPPVLTQLIAPTSGSYSSPERLRGAPPNSNDDAWALHATLYAALTGSAPFSGATKEELVKSMLGPIRRLETFGVSEPRLELIFEAGFSRHPSRRPGVGELASALAAWLAERESLETVRESSSIEREPPLIGADDDDEATRIMASRDALPEEPAASEPFVPSQPPRDSDPTLQEEGPLPPPSVAPPSLPFDSVSVVEHAVLPEPAPAPAAVAAPSTERSSARPLLIALAAIGVALAGAAAWFLSKASPGEPASEVVTARTASAAPSRPVEPQAPASAPAATADSGGPALAEAALSLSACVAAHFPPNAFGEAAGDAGDEFGFLCEEKEDLRGLASRLHRKIVVAGGGRISDAMRNWSSLGWYELPATAVVRRACCPSAPIVMPPNQGPCKQLAEVVAEVAEQPVREADAHTRAAMYGEAVFCMFYYGVKRPYRYKGHPQKNQEESFTEFLRRAARVPASQR